MNVHFKDLAEFSRKMRIKEFFTEKKTVNSDPNLPTASNTSSIHFEQTENTNLSYITLKAPSTWSLDTEQSTELDLYLKSISKEMPQKQQAQKR